MKTWKELYCDNRNLLNSTARYRGFFRGLWASISTFSFLAFLAIATINIRDHWWPLSSIILSLILVSAGVMGIFMRRKVTSDWDELIQEVLKSRQMIMDHMKMESEGEEWRD